MTRYRVTFTVDLEASMRSSAVELARERLDAARVDCRELPPAERVTLAEELRALRKQANKIQEEAAAEMEWSDSKMSRIESGSVGVTARDVRDLLDFYGVDGPERERLIQAARDLRGRS